MPSTPKFNRPNLFGGPSSGSGVLFAIVQWKGFMGALAQEYATVTGTITEVATPFGTGIRTAAASYVSFNWKTLCPEGASPRSIFSHIYFPDTGNFGAVSFGGAGVRDYTFVGPAFTEYWGGLNGDWDSSVGGTGGVGWHTIALTNAGINGGANIIYADGAQKAAGTNGAAASSTYDSLYLMTIRGIVASPLGTVTQVVVVWNRVITAAEYLTMHNWCLANSLY